MGAERTAEDVFRLLSDEIRLKILRAVAEAQRDERETGVAALAFSDIYDRVDVENTSKLSYHLGELTGTFLRKHDDGYAFTHAGDQLIRFILAENYQPPSDVEAVHADSQCLYCGEKGLVGSVEDQFFLLRCEGCDKPAYSYRIRPAQVHSQHESDLIEAVIWEQTADFLKMAQNVCPECGGRMETEIIPATDAPIPATFATLTECVECLRFMSVPLPYFVAYHPDSVAFHWDHDIDIMGTGMWELHELLHEDAWTAEEVDDEEAAFRVELRRDSASLRVFVDDEGNVTRTERVQRREQPDRRT